MTIGVLLLLLPSLNRKWAQRVCYLLTDKRAITWEPVLFSGVTVRSFSPDQMSVITRQENADGSGSLIFQEYSVRDMEGDRTTYTRGFLHIDEVKAVELLVRQTLLDD